MSDRERVRFKVGAAVVIEGREASPAKVVRHGRDAQGVYTEVQFEDGAREKVHRSYLHPLTAAGVSA